MADNLPDVYLRFLDDVDNQRLLEDDPGDPVTPLIVGDSLDAAYPGKEGWLGIKQFGFSFGWGGKKSDAKFEGLQKKVHANKATPQEHQEFDKLNAERGKGGTSGAEEGTLKPNPFSFSRNPSPATIPLLKQLRDGEPKIEKVQVIVCRAAGAGTPDTPKGSKVPFLMLILETIHLAKSEVTISKDEALSEHMEFEWKKATLATVWTDNATGKRTTGAPRTASFDTKDQEQDGDEGSE